MKLISGANGSGFYAYSANSAAIATNDDLGRKISDTYLTAVDLSPYATTAQVNTVSSLLSAGLDYVSANAGADLSAGEGIDISTVDGKTVITNNISAGQNISLVYDVETNTYRIDSQAGGTLVSSGTAGDYTYIDCQSAGRIYGKASSLVYETSGSVTTGNITHYAGKHIYLNGALGTKRIYISADSYPVTATVEQQQYVLNDTGSFTAIVSNYGAEVDFIGGDLYEYAYCNITANSLNGLIIPDETSFTGMAQDISDLSGAVTTLSGVDTVLSGAIDYLSGNAGKTYTGESPIVVNNTTDKISLDTTDTWSLSAGRNMSIDEVGKTLVFNATGDGTLPITGVEGTTAFTADATFSSFNLNNTFGNLTIADDYVKYNHAPAMSESATWIDILHAANAAAPEKPNCYCYKLDSSHTAVDLATLSAYDKVTIVHGQEGAGDYNLYWDGNTKIIHSASYCELVKVLDDSNNVKWTFTTSGWTNDNWWDYD
jgi:hypothetical protein